MTAQPGHRVNDGRIWVDQPVGRVAEVDFAAAGRNVSDWGGQLRIYSTAVTAGLALLDAPDTATARSLGLLAAWRAGTLDLRDAALGAITEMRSRGIGEVAAAVLGLPAGALADFLAGQAASGLAWPLLERSDVVARVGGFVGLDGVWFAPPVAVVAGPGRALLVRCANDEWWRLEADVFGARLRRCPTSADPAGGPPAGVQVWPTSYLVRLTGEAR